MNKNKCYIAREQNAVVKVLTTPKKVLQEIEGIRVFKKYVITPKIEQIDQRTVEVSLINGKVIDIKNTTVNHLIVKLFEERSNNPLKENNSPLSIFGKIDEMKVFFKDYPKVLKALVKIEKNLYNVPMFPVHGDLQRQNIFIVGRKLSLIDFEHFIYAPLELDIVNSIFFSDSNCLLAEEVILDLLWKKIFRKSLLFDMLYFYSIYQLSEGRAARDVINRYKKARQKLNALFNRKPALLSV